MIRRCAAVLLTPASKRPPAATPSVPWDHGLSDEWGRIEVAQRMVGHAKAKITGLYDRRNDDISVSEVERIGI
jgi:hypothetical protein